MDPLSIVTSVITLISAASSLGSKLHKLYDPTCAATHQFETFSNEVRTFGMLWQAVLPCLEDRQGVFSDELLRTLRRIRRDTSDYLQDAEASIDRFARRERHERNAERSNALFLACFSFDTPSQRKNRRVKRYLSRNNFALLRSRLDFATKFLSVVLAVINHATTHSSPQPRSHSPDHERLLIEEQDNARRRVLEQERRARRPLATYWLESSLLEMSEEDLGPGRRSPRPLDVLADRWTRSDSRLGRRASVNFIRSASTLSPPPNGPPDGQGPARYPNVDHSDCAREMSQLRADIERLTAEVSGIQMHRTEDAAVISGLQATVDDLEEQNISLRKDLNDAVDEYEELQRLVDSLEEGRYDLQSECDRLRKERAYLLRKYGEPSRKSYNIRTKDLRGPTEGKG